MALDREQQSSYQLVVVVQDGGTPPRTATGAAHITVLDENDHAPAFTHTPADQEMLIQVRRRGLGNSWGAWSAQTVGILLALGHVGSCVGRAGWGLAVVFKWSEYRGLSAEICCLLSVTGPMTSFPRLAYKNKVWSLVKIRRVSTCNVTKTTTTTTTAT